MLNIDDLDVIDLCVPNYLHSSMTIKAAKAKKHIICTKPLTVYIGQDLKNIKDFDIKSIPPNKVYDIALKEAETVVDAAEKNGVKLMYGENWVYAPSICRALELIKTADGDILEMKGWEAHSGSHSLYSKQWKHVGGGALLRTGSHPSGAMLFIKMQEGITKNGKPILPIKVLSELKDLSKIIRDKDSAFIARGWEDVSNWGCAIITFSDGSVATAYGSDVLLGGVESKLEIMASNYRIKCNMSPTDLLNAYTPSDAILKDEYIQEKASTSCGWTTPMPDEDWTSGQYSMIDAFIRNILDDTKPLSNGELGKWVVKVVYGAHVSSVTEKAFYF